MTTDPGIQVYSVHRPDLIICVDSNGIPRRLLEDLEADLRQEYESHKNNSSPGEVAEKEWCLIACPGVEPVACKRGYVISRESVSSQSVYDVLLCDYGELKKYKKEYVFPLSRNLRTGLQPRYFVVKIDGIKPPLYSRNGDWPPHTYKAARGWVEKKGRITLLSKLHQDRIFYIGDLGILNSHQHGQKFLPETYSSYLKGQELAQGEDDSNNTEEKRTRSNTGYQSGKERSHPKGNLNSSRKNSDSSTRGRNVNENWRHFGKQDRQLESTGASIEPSLERNQFGVRPPSVSRQASGSRSGKNPFIVGPPSVCSQVSGHKINADISTPRDQFQGSRPGQRGPEGAGKMNVSHGRSLQRNPVLTQTKVINKYHYPSAIRNQSDSGQEVSPQMVENPPQVALTTPQNSKIVDLKKDSGAVATKVPPAAKEDSFEKLDDADLYVDEVEPFDPTKAIEVGESKPTGKTRMLNYQSKLYNIMSQGNLKTAFKPQASPVPKKANLFQRIKDPDGCFENVYDSALPTEALDNETCEDSQQDSHSFVVAPVLSKSAQNKRQESMNVSDLSVKTGGSKFKGSSDEGSSIGSSSSKAKSTRKISRFGEDSHLPDNPFYIIEVKADNEDGKKIPSEAPDLVTTKVASLSSSGKPHRSPFKCSLPEWKEIGKEADSKPSCTSDTESSLSTLSESASPVDSDTSSRRNVLSLSSTSGVGSSGEGNVSTSSDGNESPDVKKNSMREVKAERRSFIPSGSLGTWKEKTETFEPSESTASKGAVEEKEVMKVEEAVVSPVCAEIENPPQASTNEALNEVLVKEAEIPIKEAEIPIKEAEKVPIKIKEAEVPIKEAEVPIKEAEVPIKEAEVPIREAEVQIKEAASVVDSVVVAMPNEQVKQPQTDPEVLKNRLLKMIGERAFVYAEDLSLVTEPYTSNKDFPLWHFVDRGLQNNKVLSKFNSLQSNVIPNLMRGSNVIIADNENTGKSLAYMIPVVAKVMEHCNSIKKQVKGPVPPRAVILTGCVAHGNKVWEQLDYLLDSQNNKQTSGYLVIQNDEKTREELQRGADILITTPEVFNEMMDKYLPYFSFEGLMYLIVDDTEILMRSKLQILAQLLKKVQHGLTGLGPREIPIQYIFCGDAWSEAMEQSMGIVDNPVMVLGPMQAIAFGGVKLQVSYAKDKEDKLKQLSDLMSEVTKSKETTKIIVFCKSNESLRLVQSVLKKNLDVDVSVVIQRSVGEDPTWSSGIIQAARKKWEDASPGSVQVLLCTDEVVGELGIVDATRVVHFDTGDKIRNFQHRFTTMWWWFRSKQEQEKLKCGPLISNVFVTPDEDQLHRMIAKLKEIGAAIPQKLEDDVEQMKRSQEKGERFCPGLVWFGFCEKLDPRKCHRRHELFEKDVQLRHMIPTFGQVEVRITKMVSMSAYIVQLLRHFEVQGGRAKLVTHYEEILQDRIDYLAKYYGSPSNKVPVNNLKPGDYCAVWDDSREIYLRAKAEDTKITEGCYRLFCLDTGYYVQRSTDQVYVLPEEYDRLPDLCVEMIVANMKPPLGERNYLLSHRRMAHKLTEHKVFVGRICLSLGQRIWVDPLKEMTSDITGKPMVKRSLRRELFDRKFAEDNPEHMKTLYALCEQAGYSCKQYEKLLHEEFDAEFYKEFYQRDDPIQWAHLPICSKDNLETVMVWTSVPLDADRFVCYQKKFTEQLDELVKEIDNEIAELVASNKYKNDYALKQYYQTETVVAVRDPSTTSWMRALITYINQDDDMLFNVLLVDIGEELYDVPMSSLHPLPSKFVSRLPFQAITVTITHVCPRVEEGVEPGWSSEANALTEYNLFKENMESTVAEVAAYSRLETSGKLYGNEYGALVFAKYDELGEKLVKAGFADESVEWKVEMEKLRAALLRRCNDIVDQSLAVGKDSSGSGEDDVEDINMSAVPVLDSDDEGSLDKWDFAFDPNFNPMETFLGIDMEAPPVQHFVVTDPKLTRSESSVRIEEVNDEESASTKAVFPLEQLDGPLKKPKTVWKEVEGEIVLSVELADLKYYDVKVVDKSRLCFKTIDPEGYGFDIDLLHKVEEDVKVLPLGLRCEIRLKKRMNKLKWHRLTKDVRKRRWLHLDCYVRSSESDDSSSDNDCSVNLHRCKPKKKALKKKRRALVPVVFDESTSSSDAVDEDGICDLDLG